ncbi:MAG TPA: ABC transporter ATP-binding protein [Bacillota bacterium]|nr:ABC transporter ATP-binding protein [Bacillota bacterium]
MTVAGNGSELAIEGIVGKADFTGRTMEQINENKEESFGRWAIKIQNISKSFEVRGKERIEAIKDINLWIEPGEFVCLVGPSGCGKSTLLNIIAGLEQPDSGTVESCPVNGDGCAPQGNRLLIFQESALFPWLTVFDNVAYGLKLRHTPKEKCEQLVHSYLELVGLSHFKKAYIHQLSGGMKQRVALARALVLDPEILLMDEPFAALDIKTRKDMYQLLLKIWKETGKTILFITHNVDEALILSSRVVVMSSRPGLIKREYRLEMGYPRMVESAPMQKIRCEILQAFIDHPASEVQGGLSDETVDE